MTLAKAIEAARDLADCVDGNYKEVADELRAHLAALPDKPKSEDELLLIVKKHVKGMANPEIVRATIQALKSAGVLYVDEK